jgi:hypothetical protein
MSLQRINFYQQEFHPLRVVLPLRQILQIASGLLAIMVIVTLYQTFSLRALKKDIVDLEEVNTRQTLRLQELGAEVEKSRQGPGLEEEMQRLGEALESRQRLLATLRDGSATRKVRYSDMLDGLLASAPGDLWISAIILRDQGQDVTVEGNAARPPLLPEYVAKLRASTALQGLPFSVVDMTRANTEGRLRFKLGSREEPTNAKP